MYAGFSICIVHHIKALHAFLQEKLTCLLPGSVAGSLKELFQLCWQAVHWSLAEDVIALSATESLNFERSFKATGKAQARQAKLGQAIRNNKLLGAPGHTTRSKDATRGSWHRY